MNKPIKILWIEEETENALAEKRAYMQTLWEYDLVIAETYNDGKKEFQNLQLYDVVIIDIRIPKGFNGEKNDTASIMHAHDSRYGLDLISELYKIQKSLNKLMIYTNESWIDIKEEIEPLGNADKDCFLQKKDCRSNKDFEKFILKVYNNSQKRK